MPTKIEKKLASDSLQRINGSFSLRELVPGLYLARLDMNDGTAFACPSLLPLPEALDMVEDFVRMVSEFYKGGDLA